MFAPRVKRNNQTGLGDQILQTHIRILATRNLEQPRHAFGHAKEILDSGLARREIQRPRIQVRQAIRRDDVGQWCDPFGQVRTKKGEFVRLEVLGFQNVNARRRQFDTQ
jgi:hypothetical protein